MKKNSYLNLGALNSRSLMPAYLWLVLIFVVSSIPHLKVTFAKFPNSDKIAHFSEYLIFGLLFKHGLYREDKSRISNVITVIGVIIVFATIDEIHQLIVPGRTASVYDFISDFLGGAIFSQLYELFVRGKNVN